MPTLSSGRRAISRGVVLGCLFLAGCAQSGKRLGTESVPHVATGTVGTRIETHSDRPALAGHVDERVPVGDDLPLTSLPAETDDVLTCEMPQSVPQFADGPAVFVTAYASSIDDRPDSAHPVPLTVAVEDVADAESPDTESPRELNLANTPVLLTGNVPIGGLVSVPPAPDGDELDAAPIETNVYPLNLGTALALVAGRNPQIEFADARVREAQWQYTQAKVLWLPSLRAGTSFNRHDGTLQASDGQIVDVNRSSLEAGMGVQAVGAGSPVVPGVLARFHLADAIFQPMIAQRALCARESAATAVMHDRLLSAALAYLDLLSAEQLLAIRQETLENTRKLATLTARFAETGQGAEADADRAQAELSFRRNEVVRSQEGIAVASARLAEVLSMDSQYSFRPADMALVPIQLTLPDLSVRDAVATGLATRPELRENQFLVSEAVHRLKRERYSPLVPSVLLGLSYGGFGGGLGDTVSSFHDRADFDAVLFWEVRNLGLGERAARNVARAQVEQARSREIQNMDLVAREIVEAHTQVESRRRQISIAESGITSAEQSYRRNASRIFEGQGLPIEVLQSIQALEQARRDYLRSVTDFDEAQFRLHRALGWPIQPVGSSAAVN